MEPTTTTNPPTFTPSAEPPKGRKSKLLFFLLAAIVAIFLVVFLLRTDKTYEGARNSVADVPAAEVSITETGAVTSFSPATIKVKRNQQVTWTNNGDENHQVGSDPHPLHDGTSGFLSPEPLKPGDSFTYKYSEAGTYTYHDEADPVKARGTVIVE